MHGEFNSGNSRTSVNSFQAAIFYFLFSFKINETNGNLKVF